MKTTPVSANAYQLTRLGLINCYLLRESDGFTLIDTGIKGSGDAILAAAASFSTPIRRILLTHAHGDHVGSVDELMQKLASGPDSVTPIELAASERSLPLLQIPPDKRVLPSEAAGAIKGSLPGIQIRPTRTVAEGDLYGSLRVIETPGHIPGQLSFLDERDGTLYAGDALVAVGRLMVSGFAPWYFPLPNFATWNKQIALASANKLLAYPIERFAAGHGIVRDGGIPALRQALASAR